VDELKKSGIDTGKAEKKLLDARRFLGENEFLKAFELMHECREETEALREQQRERVEPSKPPAIPSVVPEVIEEKGAVVPSPKEQLEQKLPMDLEAGYSYLIKEPKPKACFELFRTAVKTSEGLCISSTFPKKVRKEFELDDKIEVRWLSDTTYYDDVLDPRRLNFEIFETIRGFAQDHERSVILLDGIELLISANGFQEVVKFLKSVTDMISITNSTFVVSFVTGTLDEREEKILEKRFDRVQEY
jgi:hypothetical protein